jgi:hypothetical protein
MTYRFHRVLLLMLSNTDQGWRADENCVEDQRRRQAWDYFCQYNEIAIGAVQLS